MPNLSTQSLEYEPLPSKTSIRLVSFVQCNNDRAPPVHCGVPMIELSLETVDLDDEPYYNALSYTWGSPFPKSCEKSKEYEGKDNLRPIIVNGHIHYIGRNLYEFLHQAQRRFAKNVQEYRHEVTERFRPGNKTRLIMAAEEGVAEDVQRQLELGAELDAQDYFGETALHYAAENGHFEIVQLLVNNGSDPDLRDLAGRTPLRCAIQRKRGAFTDVAYFLGNVEHLRQPSRSIPTLLTSGIGRIWIDSICINQSDIFERNSQVGMMSEIYSRALSVIVWLGVEDEHTSIARQTIDGSDHRALTFWAVSMVFSLVETPTDMSVTEALSLRSKGARNQEYASESMGLQRQASAIANLLERTWFTRVWVIQELALARQVQILCGEEEIRYDNFFALLPHMQFADRDFGEASMQEHLHTARMEGRSGVEVCILADIRLRASNHAIEKDDMLSAHAEMGDFTISPSWKKRPSIQLLSTMAWWFQAADPRDKVFALLGIADGVEGGNEIRPDYTKSTAELFIEYGKVFMRGSPEQPFQTLSTGKHYTFECLEGLSYVQDNPDVHPRFSDYKQQLPSWTPNFSASLITHRIWSTKFSAGGSSSEVSQILPCTDPTILGVNASELDEISLIEHHHEGGHQSPDIAVGWLELIQSLSSTYISGGSTLAAFQRTLTADAFTDTENHDEKNFYRFLLEKLSHVSNLHYLESLLDQLRPSDSSNILPSMEDIGLTLADDDTTTAFGGSVKWLFSSARGRYHKARCLFRTKRGYLGLGTRALRPGDEVWLLAGARTPFILRKPDYTVSQTDTHRILIGESYVDGIMNGEAVREGVNDFRPVYLV